jgi:4a-hydroxytetrahydrobiopterin dehydratase
MTPDLLALSALDCRPGAPLLPASELKQRTAAMPGWGCADNRLTKTFPFADYYRTIAFVNARVYIANRQDHHPDLSVHFNRVVVSFATHEAGGITLNDCICAAKIEVFLAP